MFATKQMVNISSAAVILSAVAQVSSALKAVIRLLGTGFEFFYLTFVEIHSLLHASVFALEYNICRL